MACLRIGVRGLVQGVGFRPFVVRLARQCGVQGWVRNGPGGVDILACARQTALDALIEGVRAQAPPLARVEAVTIENAPLWHGQGFAVLESANAQRTNDSLATAPGPDVATCPQCMAELFDPLNRRWRHPFIACTHCGPRYTVTRALPYDRIRTSLAPFALCADCEREYRDATDRRFHAETQCCPHCGPRLTLLDAQGHAQPGDPITMTWDWLRNGAVVAIKGLGGFHLACDARNAQAVQRLRSAKQRDAKPFAVMAANAPSLRAIATVDAAQQEWLESRQRPIVLLRACAVPLEGVSPGLDSVGAMLPATPVQYLLFHEAAGRPEGCQWLQVAWPTILVMTSANLGSEPILRTAKEVLQGLAGRIDGILDADRDIVARCDDSVLRVIDGSARFVRSSRGLAPVPVRLPGDRPSTLPSVVAWGAYLKNTVCVTRRDEAFVSPHIGDLDSAATRLFQRDTVDHLVELLGARPTIVAMDLHPDDPAALAAQDYAQHHALRTVRVQHHHAHIAAVCAEHAWTRPILGLALDGMGWGSDGMAWGGELLHLGSTKEGVPCTRLGHLRPLPLPGGDRAAREPWRMACAVSHLLGRPFPSQWVSAPATPAVPTAPAAHPVVTAHAAQVVADMLRRGVHCPPSTGMGRYVDAAAALLGLCTHQRYEAHAAVLLEDAAARHIDAHGWPAAASGGWTIDERLCLDFLPLLGQLDCNGDVAWQAAVFHATIAEGLAEWLRRARDKTGIDTVALAGGVFLNALLSSQIPRLAQGYTLLFPRQGCVGDAGIALGQAWVAVHAVNAVDSMDSVR